MAVPRFEQAQVLRKEGSLSVPWGLSPAEGQRAMDL